MKRLFIAGCIALCLSLAASAQNVTAIHTPSVGLIVVPTRMSLTRVDGPSYALYAVYDETGTTLLAAFNTRQRAEVYASQLVKKGKYRAYRYMDYAMPPEPTVH